jgi:hypothetical protein
MDNLLGQVLGNLLGKAFFGFEAHGYSLEGSLAAFNSMLCFRTAIAAGTATAPLLVEQSQNSCLTIEQGCPSSNSGKPIAYNHQQQDVSTLAIFPYSSGFQRYYWPL